eukprot:gene11170-biopygen3118
MNSRVRDQNRICRSCAWWDRQLRFQLAPVAIMESMIACCLPVRQCFLTDTPHNTRAESSQSSTDDLRNTSILTQKSNVIKIFIHHRHIVYVNVNGSSWMKRTMVEMKFI